LPEIPDPQAKYNQQQLQWQRQPQRHYEIIKQSNFLSAGGGESGECNVEVAWWVGQSGST